MALTCAKCGAKQGFMATLSADISSGEYVCDTCKAAENRAKREYATKIRALAEHVVVTSTPRIDGYYVEKYLGIESVEFVIGTGIFSEVSTSISDFFGARSSAFERKLQEAKKHAMDALKFLAAEKGANAVLAVDLDYSEFSGNRIALIINGTLAKVARAPSRSIRAPE